MSKNYDWMLNAIANAAVEKAKGELLQEAGYEVQTMGIPLSRIQRLNSLFRGFFGHSLGAMTSREFDAVCHAIKQANGRALSSGMADYYNRSQDPV